MGEQMPQAAAAGEADREEEYVLLDLEDVFHGGVIPANCPYTLSGLNTRNPVMLLGNGLRLIGEYQDTVGKCVVFSETDAEPPETLKKVKPLCMLEKRIKFRVMK